MPVIFVRPKRIIRRRRFIPSAQAGAIGSIAGECALSFSVAGTLTGDGALVGSAAMVFDDGASTLVGKGALAGSSAIVFANAATLTADGALAGSAAMVFDDGASTLTGTGALAG